VLIAQLIYNHIVMKIVYLTDFKASLPTHELTQNQALTWIARMHADCEANLKGLTIQDQNLFFEKLSTFLDKLGLGSGKIQTRRVFFDDFFKESSDSNIIYNLEHGPQGAYIDHRMSLYDKHISAVFDELYQSSEPPDHLIHTTCTGYLSPSAAQKLVSLKGWSSKTQVTHAYHMGCYASIPSIRIADAFIKQGARLCNVVHSEFCSLHMNPLNHSIGQLVIESLFADGVIKYSVQETLNDKQPGFRILAIKEELIPDSIHGMSWEASRFGFNMTLSKDVPFLIKEKIKEFVENLLDLASVKNDIKDIFFAIHPGGPKIIEQVAESLGLIEAQYDKTKEVLKCRGNMSSATLPHVWEKILHEKNIPQGSIIVSLAFGPGLTVAGAVFEKV
jgi:predicted naringenin-chalcone synthase